MNDLNIAVVYFSATRVTETIAREIHAGLADLGCRAQLIDVTPFSARRSALPVDRFDAFVFGFPVFADFAPRVIHDWIPSLDGRGKPCATFFTYGGRTAGYAHYHTYKLLEAANFRVQFTAEFLGRHSFNVAGWRALPGRPDEADFAVARRFAALAAERFSNGSPDGFCLQKPFAYVRAIELLQGKRDNPERSWANPVRFTDCSLCGTCEADCPNQAMDSRTGLSDPAKCIECMRCVYNCPDKALKLDDHMGSYYPEFLKEWNLTDKMMEQKQSKIITAAWQAVF
jgi:ferredoxin/flavodoxin